MGRLRCEKASSATSETGGRPRGFLLVDTWGKVDAATALISAGEPLTPEQLAALLG